MAKPYRRDGVLQPHPNSGDWHTADAAIGSLALLMAQLRHGQHGLSDERFTALLESMGRGE